MSAPIDNDVVRTLLPHAGTMCLIDRVTQWSAQEIRCTTETHRDLNHPLRRDHQLAALHLAEYAAQAAALHGALLADRRPQPGMLAALREIALHVDRIDTFSGALTIVAARRLARAEGLIYAYTIHQGDTLLSSGRLSIALN